jgi:hypothetical protein
VIARARNPRRRDGDQRIARAIVAARSDVKFGKAFIYIKREVGLLGLFMASRAVKNKPTAAYVLSLIGGLIGLIVGFLLIVLAAIVARSAGGYYNYGYPGPALPAAFWGDIGVWCLIIGIIVIISAAKLNANPWKHTEWGLIILVFSIIGLATLLGSIGGILALVYKPQPLAPEGPVTSA